MAKANIHKDERNYFLVLLVRKGYHVWKLLRAKSLQKLPDTQSHVENLGTLRWRVYFLGNSESFIKMVLKIPWHKQGATGIFCLHPFFFSLSCPRQTGRDEKQTRNFILFSTFDSLSLPDPFLLLLPDYMLAPLPLVH